MQLGGNRQFLLCNRRFRFTLRVDLLAHPLARARPERAGPGDGPTGAAAVAVVSDSIFAIGCAPPVRRLPIDVAKFFLVLHRALPDLQRMKLW